jgi:hypothetical protein
MNVLPHDHDTGGIERGLPDRDEAARGVLPPGLRDGDDQAFDDLPFESPELASGGFLPHLGDTRDDA